MRALAVAAFATISLAACSYLYENPVEKLGVGEAMGRVVADRSGTSAPTPFPDVTVSLKGGLLDQTTRATGNFFVLPLQPGRHTLMFRKGLQWALDRDVDIVFGRDGQPEGVELGDVELKYSAGVAGRVVAPSGFGVSGEALDTRTGLTTPIAGGSGAGNFTFPALAVGTHTLYFAGVDSFDGITAVVGGPVTVTIGESDQLTTKGLNVVSAPAVDPTSNGRIVFQVRGASLTAPDYRFVQVTALQLTAVLGTFVEAAVPTTVTHPDSSGLVDMPVPEGPYVVKLQVVATPVPRRAPVAGPATGLAAAGGAGSAQLTLTPPPGAPAFVVKDKVTDIGVLYLTDLAATSPAARTCLSDADCAKVTCLDRACGPAFTPGTPVTVPPCGTCSFDSTTCGTTGLTCVFLNRFPQLDLCLPDCATATLATACTVDGTAANCVSQAAGIIPLP